MFLLFANEAYYASGGWGDFRGAFSSKEEAASAGRLLLGTTLKVGGPEDDIRVFIDWWHVVDLASNSIVAASRVQAYCGPEIDASILDT